MGTGNSDKTGADWTALLTASLLGPAIIMLFVVFFWPSRQSEGLAPIEIVTGEWPPFSGRGLHGHGLATEIVTGAIREAGYEPSYLFMPWTIAAAAALESETNHGIRATFPWARDDVRESRFYFSDPILTTEVTLFYHHGRTPVASEAQSIDDVRDLRAVFVEGYSYPQPIIDAFDDPIVVASTHDALKRLIETPDVHVFPEARDVGDWYLRHSFPSARHLIRSIEGVEFTIELYLMASTRNPHSKELLDELNDALRDLRQAGTLARIEGEARQRIDEAQSVLLRPYDDSGAISGFTDAALREPIAVPRGTPAVVERWPLAYLPNVEALPDGEDLALVRVLDGPLQGRRIHLDGRYIELRRASERSTP